MTSPVAPLSPSSSPTQTKAFTLGREDLGAIEGVRREDGLLSDSAALRVLIREGMKYRALRRQAEQELLVKLAPGYGSGSSHISD